jgi:hypothetical protein
VTTDDTRPPYVLRLTGEQIGSIDPPPEGDWFEDWDEYEDFVPVGMLAAERARYAALVEAAEGVRAYARHAPFCEYAPSYPDGPAATCDCGFDQVLAAWDALEDKP